MPLFSLITLTILSGVLNNVYGDLNSLTTPKPESGFFSFLPKLPSLNIFSGVPCVGTSLKPGVCEEAEVCHANGGFGEPNGLCLGGKVCCAKTTKCGEAALLNNSIFTSPDYPKPTRESGQCTYTVKLLPFVESLRIDFIDTHLQHPDYKTAECNVDSFWVEGADSDFRLGKLCGHLTGSHIYIPVTKTSLGQTVTLHFALSPKDADRKWLIRVDQLKFKKDEIPPHHCVQYHTGETGVISSFNTNLDNNTSLGNIHGLKYVICIRKEESFCGIRFDPLFWNMGPGTGQIYKAYPLPTTREERSLKDPNMYMYQPVNPQNKPQYQLSTSKPLGSTYPNVQKLANKPQTNLMRPIMKPYKPVNQPVVSPPKTLSSPLSYNAPNVTPYVASVDSTNLANFKQIEALLKNYEAKLEELYSNISNAGAYQETLNGSEYSEADHYTVQELTGVNCRGQDVVTFPPPDEGLSNHCGTSLSPLVSSSAPFLVRVNNKGQYPGQGFVLRYTQTVC